MIVAVVSAKGGVGKTTTALHLAGRLAGDAPTLLLDDDPNLSATRYAARGAQHGYRLPFAVATRATLPTDAPPTAHLVIDTPAHATEAETRALLRRADRIVVPSAPDPMSLEAALDSAGRLQRHPAWGVLLTLCPPHPETDAADARRALERAHLPVWRAQIPRAKAFVHAALLGRLVGDTRAPRAHLAAHAYHRLELELRQGAPR